MAVECESAYSWRFDFEKFGTKCGVWSKRAEIPAETARPGHGRGLVRAIPADRPRCGWGGGWRVWGCTPRRK